MYKYLFVSFLIVTLFFLSTGKLLADDGTCTPTINNFVIALEKSNCQFIGENQACYGIAEVETFPEKLFTGCGSYVNIFSGLQRIQTNDEGAALLHLRNQHEDLLKVALFGKMRLEGTGGNGYILRARGGNLLCERTQAGALLKTDANRTASIRLNSVTIRLRSAAFVTMDSVVLFDDNPRNNLRTLPNGSRNPNPLFCSGFDSECAFGDKSCPLGYRLVWGPYGRSSSYAYIEDGLYRVTMHGQGRVEAGATDWEPTHQAFSFGSNEFDLAESPSYTFCWRGNQPSSNGFETIILKRSNNAQVNRLTIEYLGPDCSGGQMEALDADFMTVTNLDGTVEVSIQGTVRILQPGEQVRIYFVNEIPVVITGPFQAVGIQDSPLLNWLISPVGVSKIQLPEISSITQCGRAITYGDVVNEAIADVGESCSYPFTGQAGDILTIQMSRQTDALDPLLILRDANGRELVENDDIGESNRNSTITNYQLPSTGAYTIVARSYDDASAGAFTLSLTKIEPIACGGDIRYGQTIWDEIPAPGAVCRYTFNGEAGDLINIRMIRQNDDGLDPWLNLLDPTGNPLAADDDSAGDMNSEIGSVKLPTSGLFTIVARSYAEYGTGSFALTIKPNQLLYDFVANANTANWWSNWTGEEEVVWEGNDTDQQGIVRWVDNAGLEDGTVANRVLEMHPAWLDDGYVAGWVNSPEITLQSGDHFIGTVGFLQNANAGNVRFSVIAWEYIPGEEFPPTLFERTVNEIYDGQLGYIDVDLSEFAGHRIGTFRFMVEANGSSAEDWAVWVDARLDRR